MVWKNIITLLHLLWNFLKTLFRAEQKPKVIKGALALAIGIVIIWEGFKPETYLDPVGIPTVCYGHTEPGLRVGQAFSKEACTDLLLKDLHIASEAYDRFVKVPTEDYVKAAFISFIYNVGAENFRKSTALKLINQGRIEEACHELPRWVYATNRDGKKVKLKGLENRRKAEMRLCLGEGV